MDLKESNFAIEKEAIRLEFELSLIDEPNSPNKTHYMAEVSPVLLKEANSKNIDNLLKSIKAKGVALSTLKTQKGCFALTSKKYDLPIYKNGTFNTKFELIRKGKDYALLHRILSREGNPYNIIDPTPFIVVLGFYSMNGKCDWRQGHYCKNLKQASIFYLSKLGFQ